MRYERRGMEQERRFAAGSGYVSHNHVCKHHDYVKTHKANIYLSIFIAAVRHLKKYVILFAAFTTNFKSELHLLNKIQEYCYDNMNFIKSFNKIVLLLYKSKLNYKILSYEIYFNFCYLLIRILY